MDIDNLLMMEHFQGHLMSLETRLQLTERRLGRLHQRRYELSHWNESWLREAAIDSYDAQIRATLEDHDAVKKDMFEAAQEYQDLCNGLPNRWLDLARSKGI